MPPCQDFVVPMLPLLSLQEKSSIEEEAMKTCHIPVLRGSSSARGGLLVSTLRNTQIGLTFVCFPRFFKCVPYGKYRANGP